MSGADPFGLIIGDVGVVIGRLDRANPHRGLGRLGA